MADTFRTLRKAWSFHSRLIIKRTQFRAAFAMGRVPVVTYATWRTASTAVHHAIRASSRWPAVKAHSLCDGHFAPSKLGPEGAPPRLRDQHVGDWVVRDSVVTPHRTADWVLMVRDPIAMAMSMLAMNREFLPTELHAHQFDSAFTASPKVTPFLDAALDRLPIHALDRWFEFDMREALGWTPIEAPFDCEAGFSVSHSPFGKMLVLRADVADQRKSQALTEFLRCQVVVKRENSAADRGRGMLHGALLARLALRPELVEAALQLPATRHFWNEEQIDAMRKRWLAT